MEIIRMVLRFQQVYDLHPKMLHLESLGWVNLRLTPSIAGSFGTPGALFSFAASRI